MPWPRIRTGSKYHGCRAEFLDRWGSLWLLFMVLALEVGWVWHRHAAACRASPSSPPEHTSSLPVPKIQGLLPFTSVLSLSVCVFLSLASPLFLR
jgi:hypothetical protein